MTDANLEIIDRFFDAYGRRDEAALRKVLADQASWIFPGRNPISGTKVGIGEVLAFFDTMGGVMAKADVQVQKLITAANDDYVIECQRLRMSAADGRSFEQEWCVLWRFEDGKIAEGRHFAADQYAADEFFGRLAA